MSILVYTENRNGEFRKPALEALSYAYGVASMSGGSVTAVATGDIPEEKLQVLGEHGASRVLVVKDPLFGHFDPGAFTSMMAQAVEKSQSKIVVMASTISGKAIAPRLAVKLKAALVTGVNGLPLSIDPLTVNRRAYSGSAFARVKLNSEISIITTLQNSYDIESNPVAMTVEEFVPEVAGLPAAVEVLEEQRMEDGKVPLTEASVIVAGGRGMKSPDNWQPLIELAELLEGATACSRPVSDEGWRPHEEHTGQTGKIVAPDLYVAAGISGATQHLAGVSGSKYIVAINTDKTAPIFEAAQYGVVGDATKVLPKLVEAVRQVKGK